MCRPSCCNNGGQGAGIAAVALIMLAALIAARIVRIADRIIHVVLGAISSTRYQPGQCPVCDPVKRAG